MSLILQAVAMELLGAAMPAKRIYHQGLARLALCWPALSKKQVDAFKPMESATIPWTPVTKPLETSKVAVVTTAGIHHKGQIPFEMGDSDGDPTFRLMLLACVLPLLLIFLLPSLSVGTNGMSLLLLLVGCFVVHLFMMRRFGKHNDQDEEGETHDIH